MVRSYSRRLSIPVLLGFLSVSGAVSAANRPALPATGRPARVAYAAENVFTRLGRLVRLWAGNGAIIDPMGHQGDAAPAATVPTGNPLDDNGAIIDPMGGH